VPTKARSGALIRVSAYRDALAVDADSPAERFALAAEILTSGSGVVILDQTLALRRTSTCISCEVVDPAPSARRCENEFEVLVENARLLLGASKVAELLPDLPRRWSVVADDGSNTAELWRAP
jgi:hypothetical protein